MVDLPNLSTNISSSPSAPVTESFLPIVRGQQHKSHRTKIPTQRSWEGRRASNQHERGSPIGQDRQRVPVCRSICRDYSTPIEPGVQRLYSTQFAAGKATCCIESASVRIAHHSRVCSCISESPLDGRLRLWRKEGSAVVIASHSSSVADPRDTTTQNHEAHDGCSVRVCRIFSKSVRLRDDRILHAPKRPLG